MNEEASLAETSREARDKLRAQRRRKISRKIIVSTVILIAIFGSVYLIEKITDRNRESKPTVSQGSDSETKPKGKGDIEAYKYISSRGIDSILFTLGIKKEWITTSFTGEKKPNDKTDKKKQGAGNVQWYLKKTEIPKDLNATEVNLELRDYLRGIGLYPIVTENIKSKEITFTVYADTNDAPLAKIFINYSDKVKR